MKKYYRTNGRVGVPSRFWQWELFTDQERLAQKDQSLIFGLRPGSFPETMLSHFVGHDFFSVADGADIALCYDLIDRAAAGFGKDQNIAPFRASICSLRAMYGLGPIPGAKNKPE